MDYSKLIEFDISKMYQRDIPCVVQGSVDDYFQVKLKQNGKPYDLTDCEVIYEIIKPDGFICSGILNITYPTSGFGIFQLSEQMLATTGICRINLSIINSSQEIKVNGLKYEVLPGISNVVSWSEENVKPKMAKTIDTYVTSRTVNKWWDFAGIPDNTVGIDGDYGLQLPNCDIWKKQSGYWERIGNIRGEDAVGLPGVAGKDGITPNFTIGTVKTIEPGLSATVTVTGTKENPILNLEIPKGDKFSFNDFTEQQLESLKVKGDKGSKWYDSSGVPAIEIGVNDDFALDVTTSDIYKKINNIWERIGNIGGTLYGISVDEIQRVTDDTLNTTNKSVVGAINEIEGNILYHTVVKTVDIDV